MSRKISEKTQQRINKAIVQIKAEIGFEFCVCFLSNNRPQSLMISNIPHHNSGLVDQIQDTVVRVLFPNLEFDISERDLGHTISLIFTPV